MIPDEGESLQESRLTDATVSAEIAGHATLKHHLLGPSLTKAGQDTVDQQKVYRLCHLKLCTRCRS